MKFLRSILCLSVAFYACVLTANAQEAGLPRLMERTAAAMEAENWQEALELGQQALALANRSDARKRYGAQFGAVHYRKGLCEMKLKRWHDAMGSFETCYRDFPNEGRDRGNSYQKMALLKWGEAAVGAEELGLALRLFAKFLDERDRERDLFSLGSFHISTAVCHYRLGHIAEGNESLEIAIRNKGNFPTPDMGIVAGFQELVSAAIVRHDEQVLLDFIGKNRGELVIDPVEMRRYDEVFLKLAGDALAAGMTRAALAVYQFVPSTEAGVPEVVKLAAVALVHERNGNVRGAYAVYLQLERYYPKSVGREDHLYHLVRTASLLGEADCARLHAGRLLKDFPKSPHLAEIREAGIAIPENEAAADPVSHLEPGPTEKPLPRTQQFSAAIDLYQGRKYAAAQAAFSAIRQHTKSEEKEAATFAAFYETECLRKLGDLDKFSSAVRSLEKDSVLGGNRLRQLEINRLWDAVRVKNWELLKPLALDLARQWLPGDQRAQIAWCHALALENTASPQEALNAYNIAMTADAGASEEITRNAALRVLSIHRKDAEVMAALNSWSTPEKNPTSPGFFRLKEAASVAALYELSLGDGTALPKEFKEFLKYTGARLEK